jgi:hypothetical protein
MKEKETNMSNKGRRGKGFGGAYLVVALIAVFGLALAAPALEAKEREGAQVIITKTDSSTVQGELLAVMDDKLILMDNSAAGVTIGLTDVRDVKVIKKGRFWKGAGIGLVAGAAIGALVGAAAYEPPHLENGWFPVPMFYFSRGELALGGGVLGGVLGGVIGGVITATTHGQKIKINAQSPESLAKTIAELRKLAKEQI